MRGSNTIQPIASDHGNGLCCGTDLSVEAIQAAMGRIRRSMEPASRWPGRDFNGSNTASDPGVGVVPAAQLAPCRARSLARIDSPVGRGSEGQDGPVLQQGTPLVTVQQP